MYRKRSSRCIVGKFLLMVVLFSVTAPSFAAAASGDTPADFKIAFIGDQALGSDARLVLNLIKSEGAQAVVHSGDFDYTDNPAAWEGQINEILGADFPYFSCIGNHDVVKWSGSDGYQQYIKDRFTRLGITWDGDLGVKCSFEYEGIFFILVAPGTMGSGHATYVADKLATDNSIWTICSWHKNMRLMQVGGKSDETGWGVYEEARTGGAIIATGHEHSYSRTYLLSSMMNQTVANTSDTLVITKGNSFVFVSGLGGNSIRPQLLSGDWWASVYTSSQGANYGALFGTFNVAGVENLATFYFKDIDGVIADSFMVLSNVESGVTGVGRTAGGFPPAFHLDNNYPNPFNPSTTIRYDLPTRSYVVLKIYNLLGQGVATLVDKEKPGGRYGVRWDAAGVASGIYFYRLQAGDFVETKKLILLR